MGFGKATGAGSCCGDQEDRDGVGFAKGGVGLIDKLSIGGVGVGVDPKSGWIAGEDGGLLGFCVLSIWAS